MHSTCWNFIDNNVCFSLEAIDIDFLSTFSKGSNIPSMASGSLGTSSIKNSNLYLISSKVNKLPESKIAKVCWTARTQKNSVSLTVSTQSDRLRCLCCNSSPGKHRDSRIEGSELFNASNFTNKHIPNTSQVESIITAICETDTVELELKQEGFQLYLKRNLTEKSADLSPLLLGPVDANTSPEEPDENCSVQEPVLAITKSKLSPKGIRPSLQKAADEGQVIVDSPKVGIFKRSRIIKGKQTPPACQQKQIVKEGQVVCYIEQLGGEIPIEADMTGEVVRILREDGDPVGYGDPLITILPSFTKIKYLK